MYKKGFQLLKKLFRPDQIFKHGFNLAPMYRRTVGRVASVSRDLYIIKVEIPLNYKNRNYAGSMFGGSLYAATDPIYMIQLLQILGDDYVVWDKSATIRYKRPARSKAFATFEFSQKEIDDIKAQIADTKKMDIVKHVNIVSASGEVFAELEKTIFISDKEHYKLSRSNRKEK